MQCVNIIISKGASKWIVDCFDECLFGEPDRYKVVATLRDAIREARVWAQAYRMSSLVAIDPWYERWTDYDDAENREDPSYVDVMDDSEIVLAMLVYNT
jgi:hypothetical protein